MVVVASTREKLTSVEHASLTVVCEWCFDALYADLHVQKHLQSTCLMSEIHLFNMFIIPDPFVRKTIPLIALILYKKKRPS